MIEHLFTCKTFGSILSPTKESIIKAKYKKDIMKSNNNKVGIWPKSMRMTEMLFSGGKKCDRVYVSIAKQIHIDSNLRHMLNYYILGSEHSTKWLCLICANR